MTRRTMDICAGLVLLLITVVGPVCYWVQRDPRPVRLYHRIDVGMSRAEVQAILGKPLSPFQALATMKSAGGFRRIADAGNLGAHDVWDLHDYLILVGSDDADKVTGKELWEAPRRRWIDMVRNWLGW